MKILNLDVEMSPAKVYVWDLKVNGYISPEKIIEPKRMLCVAAKWVDDPEIFFYSQWGDGQAVMVRRLWELLNEAHAVLHYNGTTFDIPNINTEFILEGLTPPAPYQQIDLYKAVKRRFRFLSNSLGEVSKLLDTSRKMGNDGFSLWVRVMAGEPEACDQMKRYNIADIEANEDLYKKLLPWIPCHPNKALIDGRGKCSACASFDLIERESSYTAMSGFRRFQCLKCGTWMRETRRVNSTTLREVTW